MDNANNQRGFRGPKSAEVAGGLAKSLLPASGVAGTGGVGMVAKGQHKLKQRFSVLRKLGKGTYGKVQLAINKETGQEVAIKTIKKSKIENEQFLDRVRREIQIMSSIEHPHIIHIYEVFENKDKIVLVMQYAPGGELYEYVNQSKLLDDREARRLFRQIATAIYYCHQNKICHRDLKLENILLDEKNNAKLADFGLSNVFDKRRQLSTFCGSPLYASPEIVQGCPYEGPEVDCWSLGVLLYTLVYGAMPFDGSNFKRLVRQISEANYFEPKQKSPASNLIRRLLCPNPRKRATIIDICSDSWVNGIQLLHSIPRSPTTQYNLQEVLDQQQQQEPCLQLPCNSLLLVAQDMAKLTPVRFDILRALLPPEPPLNPENQHQVGVGILSDASSRRNQQLHPDDQATITFNGNNNNNKQFAQNENTMPIEAPLASYVVRDLEEANQQTIEPTSIKSVISENEVPHTQETSGPDSPKSMEVDEVEEEAHKPKTTLREEEGDHAKVETQEPDNYERENLESLCSIETPNITTKLEKGMDETMKDEVMSCEPDLQPTSNITRPPDDTNKFGDQSNPEAEKSGDVIMEIQDTRVEHEKIPTRAEEELQTDIKKAEGEQEKMASPKVIEQEMVSSDTKRNNDVVDQSNDANAEVDINNNIIIENEMDEKGTDRLQIPMDQTDEATGSSAGDKSPVSGDSSQTKPKKMKKKIVLVKKKKKVTKKPDLQEANETANEMGIVNKGEPKVDGEKSISESQVESRDEKSLPKTSESSKSTEQINSRALRRRSTLVADMSEKLMQQLAADAAGGGMSPNANVKMEQAILFGQVNVSDKKEEYERRASLLLVEPEIEHIVPGNHQRASLNDGVSSRTEKETTTTTDQLDEDQSNDHNNNELIKNDSNETIKPAEDEELSHLFNSSPIICEHDEPIRSSFEINLIDNYKDGSQAENTQPKPPIIKEDVLITNQEADKEERSSSGRGSANLTTLGPVPITRSYKKVTFTKDGACITETSKIYATKTDDGTMRRIERKSKVTHYPASEDKFVSGYSTATGGPNKTIRTTVSESSEEFSFSSTNPTRMSTTAHSTGQFSSCWPSENHHHNMAFERLVTPSSSLHLDNQNLDASGSNTIIDNDDSLVDELFDPSDRHYRQDNQFSELLHRQESLLRSNSGSSCSSGSTDAFDDIFDNWTGAISMFGRQLHRTRLPSLSSLRANSPSPLFGNVGRRHHHHQHQHTRHHHRGGGLRAGSVQPERGDFSARCESAEPSGRRFQQEMQQDLECRPASVMTGGSGWSGMRHFRSGSRSNLFFKPHIKPNQHQNERNRFDQVNEFGQSPLNVNDMMDSDDPASSLMRELGVKHARLQEELARHKQRWRGSTPSLVQENMEQSTSNRTGNIRIPASEAPPRPPTSPRPPGTRLAGSISGTAAPLDNKPIRRNTANLSSRINSSGHEMTNLSTSTNRADSVGPGQLMQTVHRTLSKSSLISDGLSRVHLSSSMETTQHEALAASPAVKHQQVASFIELKRTSSNSLAGSASCQKVISSSTTTTTKTTAKIATSSSLARLAGEPANQRIETEPLEASPASEPRGDRNASSQCRTIQPEMTDKRIQTWLQESSSNFSSSSGSKSSASFATSEPPVGAFEIRSDTSFANLYHQHQQPLLPPILPRNESPGASTRSGAKLVLNCGQLMQPPNLTTVLGGQDQPHLSRSTPGANEAASNPPSATSEAPSSETITMNTRTTFTMQLKDGEGDTRQDTIDANTSHQIQDNHSSDEFHALADLDFGVGDSHSLSTTSSSLLDHLKSRGYRSLINQRLIGDHQNALNNSSLSATDPAASSSLSSHSSGSVVTNLAQQGGRPISTQPIDPRLKSWPPDLESGNQEDQLKHNNYGASNAKNQGEPAELPSSYDDTNDKRTQADECMNDNFDKDSGQEDDDDDVELQKSKANVNSYKERVRETELFLKSLEAADHEAQRQREQLFLFNELIIRNKLNGLTSGIQRNSISNEKSDFIATPIIDANKSALLMSNSQYVSNLTPTPGFASAPVRTRWQDHNVNPIKFDSLVKSTASTRNQDSHHYESTTNTNIYNNYQPSEHQQIISRSSVRAQSVAPERFSPTAPAASFTSTCKPSEDETSRSGFTHSITNLSSASAMTNFGNKPGIFTYSSHSNQPNQSYRPMRKARPASMSLEEDLRAPNLGRRSSSMARYSTSSDQSPPATNSNVSSAYMSEYQRSYRWTPTSTELSTVKHVSSSSMEIESSRHSISTRRRGQDELDCIQKEAVSISQKEETSHLEDDDSMDAYRPSAYVPRSSGLLLSRERTGRSYKRRSLTAGADWGGASASIDGDSTSARSSHALKRLPKFDGERRSSIQMSDLKPLANCESNDSVETKSTDGGAVVEKKAAQSSDSEPKSEWRLSELELRLEANRRRREELLASSKTELTTINANKPSIYVKSTGSSRSPIRARSVARDNGVATNCQKADDKIPMTSGRLLGRPSRLESMEARIKRRSYYVRVEDSSAPERHESLDRWHSSSKLMCNFISKFGTSKSESPEH